MAVDGKVPYYIAFDLLYYLEKEKDVLPWFAAMTNLFSLYQRLEATKVEPDMKVRI